MAAQFRLLPYLVAGGLVTAAALLHAFALAPFLAGRSPYGIFIPAVLLSAWVGGIGSGLVATALSAAAALVFAIEPELASSPANVTLLTQFLITGALISGICESLRRNCHRNRATDTALREREAELRHRGEQHRQILDAVPHLLWVTDANGRITSANQQWHDLVGLDPGEARRIEWFQIVHPDDLDAAQSVVAEDAKTGKASSFECRLQLVGGDYQWHLVHVHPSVDATGAPSGSFGTATNIDVNRRASDEIRASEERFRTLANSAPILIWIADTSKGCTWFNAGWGEFTGRPLAEELGDGWTSGIHPDDRDKWISTYSTSFDRRRPFEIDYRLRRHDGRFRWIYHRGTPMVSANDQFIGFMGGCIDIHERKLAEESRESLIKAEKAARAEAERITHLKDEFLATVSHEIRTPLTAILGWAQLIRKGLVDSLPEALETIERNARAQAQLIDDLLDMSHILSGRFRLELQNASIAEIVEAALAAAEPAAAAKDIRLIRVIAAKAGSVFADPARLQQVIRNLLNNAIKFTPAGGSVTTTLERVHSHLEISVQDTGEGIPPDFLPHVFDRFRQADASAARRHHGLGLGLSIVKQLVELHGGSVDAANTSDATNDGTNDGTGATFTIRLPVAVAGTLTEPSTEPPASELPAAAEPHDNQPARLDGVDVLVVDDDSDARDVLRGILAASGASVRTAGSAHDGLDELRRNPPAVLVSDIGMPGMDGYALIRAVRTLPREQGGHVPAVALSAFAQSEDRRRVITAGFHIHLAKPIEPTELVTVVASLASRS